MVQLSIIIVSYNVKYYLEQCLLSVIASAYKGKLDVEVFVVDNASTDDSVGYLRHKFPLSVYPYVHMISNPRNVGFGRANNQAVKLAKGKYVLFLNPDTVISEETLSVCLGFAEKKTEFGGLGTMMLHDNGCFAYESRRGMPTPWTSFCKMSGLTTLFPHSRILGKYYMRYLDKEKCAEIEIISGAFLLTRKEVLDQVGAFDEDFFMYGEDIDLSYRFLQAGYHNFYIPSPILHYKGESTKKNTFKYVHVFYNAMLIFFKKHYHNYWLGFSIPIKLTIVLSALLALIKQQCHWLGQFLRPNKKIREEKWLYVGRHSDAVCKLANEWCLDIDCIEGDEFSLRKGEMPASVTQGKYVRVIYDVADFTYGYVLDVFRKSAHDQYIGFYHSMDGILVTGTKVYPPQKLEIV